MYSLTSSRLSSLAVALVSASYLCCGEGPSDPESEASVEQQVTPTSYDLNDDFEAQRAPQGSFVVSPSNSEWFFSGGGLKGFENTANGSWLAPPEGIQQAFLQSGGGMHRMVALKSGDHVLTLKLARGDTAGGSPTVPVQVLVNGTLAASFAGNVYDTYQSQIAIITGSGNTLISILNANGGAEALIDDLKIVHGPSNTTLVQSGFEAPSTSGSFVYQPANTEWLALGSGVAQSAYMADGTVQRSYGPVQFGFLMSSGTLQRNVSLRGGLYVMTVYALRSTQLGGNASLPVEVYVNNQKVASFVPTTVTTASAFQKVTASFIAPAGNVPFRLQNADGAPLTFVDTISLARY